MGRYIYWYMFGCSRTLYHSVLEREKYWADIYTGTCLVVLELSIIVSWRERSIGQIYILVHVWLFSCIANIIMLSF